LQVPNDRHAYCDDNYCDDHDVYLSGGGECTRVPDASDVLLHVLLWSGVGSVWFLLADERHQSVFVLLCVWDAELWVGTGVRGGKVERGISSEGVRGEAHILLEE